MARDDGERQAMSDERLEAITRRFHVAAGMPVEATTQIERDALALLAEVERLRAAMAAQEAREAALLAVVRAVATQDCAQDIDDPEWMQCLACGGGGPTGETIEHHEICYYVKARVLLASAGESERSGGDGA